MPQITFYLHEHNKGPVDKRTYLNDSSKEDNDGQFVSVSLTIDGLELEFLGTVNNGARIAHTHNLATQLRNVADSLEDSATKAEMRMEMQEA